MKVLVACEYSGIVRDAFTAKGHEAWSVDLLPSESPGNHYEGDLFDFWCQDKIGKFESFDLMVAHPPCTYLTNAANRWLYEDSAESTAEERLIKRAAAIVFFQQIQKMPIDKIAIENPQPHPYVMEKVGRFHDKIQPYMFEEPETKGICLWLKNLPPLMSTVHESKREAKVHFASPGKDRSKIRSRFYPKIAEQMAIQWGEL
jgi:hypothetical protein